MRAYPDNPVVLRAVDSQIDELRQVVDSCTKDDSDHDSVLNTGVPGSRNAYEYSYMVLQRLVELYPGCMGIDWDYFRNLRGPRFVSARCPGERALRGSAEDGWYRVSEKTGRPRTVSLKAENCPFVEETQKALTPSRTKDAR
jgi:hypothetical protein